MREEIIDILNRTYGKDSINDDVADYFISIFKNVSIRKVKEIVGETSYVVYDQMYFAENARADLIRDDVLELTETVLETL